MPRTNNFREFYLEFTNNQENKEKDYEEDITEAINKINQNMRNQGQIDDNFLVLGGPTNHAFIIYIELKAFVGTGLSRNFFKSKPHRG